MRQIIVGIGELLWDLLPGGKKLGGAPANFTYHATALGHSGIVASCVGDDPLGCEIRTTLEKLSLETAYIALAHDFPTGTVAVRLDPMGVPTYDIKEGVAWDHIPPSPQFDELAAQADAICFGSLAQRAEQSRRTIHAFVDKARPEALRVFDVNLRQHFFTKEIIQQSLHLANVLKVSDEELPTFQDALSIPHTGEDAITFIADEFNLEAVALTRGSKGSVLFSGGEISRHNGFPAKVVDTVGAGDSFTAALVAGLLSGFSLDEINEKANRLAAYVCSRPGGTPELPYDIVSLFET